MPPVVSRLLMALACLIAPAARADEHRVEPGQEWSRLAGIVKPGDEIVLMRGVHRPASLAGLTGAPGRPIVIRGDDVAHPARIEVGKAGGSGLYMQRPRHVEVRDVVVGGATHNGINIDDTDAAGSIGEPWRADLTIRRVRIEHTGPRGNTDGIKLSGLREVRVVDCTVEGWGGSAIDLVGCHGVVIEGCTFRGLSGHDQSSGVQVKGGSADVRIQACRFENAGQRAVNLGGSTGLAYFRPRVPDDAEPGSRYEAENVTVEGCIMVGGDSAVAFVGSRGGVVRRCTIIGARRWAFRLLHENSDPRFAPSEGGVIEDCLIVWPDQAPRTLINIGPGTRPESWRFGVNLWWWSGADGNEGPRMIDLLPGERAGGQVLKNPLLDGELRPANPDTSRFGAPKASGR